MNKRKENLQKNEYKCLDALLFQYRCDAVLKCYTKDKKKEKKKKDNEKKTYAICDYPNTKRNVTFASIKYFI